MCRLYGFRSNEPTKVECTLVHAQNALLLQSQEDEIGRSHPDGWGIAYYDGGTPHLQKNSSAAFEGLHFSNTAERVYSHTVVSHVRLATVGNPSQQNCHPFNWGNWVFAHNGTVAGIDTLRSELTNEISRTLRREILGSTDSELLFHWLIQRALDRQAIDCQECRSLDALTNAIIDSIAELDQRCKQASPNKPAKLNTILTDGNVLVASRLRNSLCIVHRDGIRDCEICGIPHVNHHAGTPYYAVVLASEPLSHEAWELIPDAHVVSVNQAMIAETKEIPIEGMHRRRSPKAIQKRHREQCDDRTAARIAQRLLLQKPELNLDPLLEDVRCKKLEEHCTLHVDDYSEIPNLTGASQAYYQERARLRAKAGDLIATGLLSVPGYEAYCQQSLGLGDVQWVCPESNGDPIHLAESCWQDRGVRRDIVHAIRSEDLRYIHPHMGTRAVWELALLLHQASHRPVEVIGPPPGVTKFANDKGEFTRLVRTLLGSAATPPGHVVWNIATAAKQLRSLTQLGSQTVALKLPNAAGGHGNLLLPVSDIKDLTLTEIDELLRRRLPKIDYDEVGKLLVTSWATDVLAAPSAQLWIPPIGHGPFVVDDRLKNVPTVDGIFIQIIDSEEGNFSGFRVADLPAHLNERIKRESLLLARVYQWLGYVGRCSFDMILIGPNMDNCDIQFIECNGRWGGTSLPMTLIDQITGDWRTRTFANRMIRIPGIGQVTFDVICRSFSNELYRKQSQTGRYVLYNPQRMIARDLVSLIAWLDSKEQEEDVIDRAKEILTGAVAGRLTIAR